jgi:RNA polymerase sigma-70 factor (ECF subfamily)
MDTDVVIRAQHGDEQAFTLLAAGSGRRLNALAVGILRDRTLAEDAVQAALVSIWRDLPTLRDPSRFEAWSYRLLLRACYAEAKRQRRDRADTVGLSTPLEPVAQDDYATIVDRDQLARGFARLSLEHRAVLVLHYYLDLSHEGVAEALGIPSGTVRSRIHRAMAALRASIETDGRPGPAMRPPTAAQGALR